MVFVRGELLKHFWIYILAAAILLPACSATRSPDTADPAYQGTPPASTKARVLAVYAAASLTDAFTEIAQEFEALHPGVTVSLNFGGSQTLRAQIEQGAQADIFASANANQMDALVEGNYIAADTPKIFLNNQLVVILPPENPAGLSSLADLANSGLKIILAAQEVPVGSYALQALDKLDTAIGSGYKENVLANVVSYENDVRQVVTKVQLGEADAGIVYTSDAVAVPDLQIIAIPAESNVAAGYPIAALAQSKNAALAQDFIAYVLSTDGQAILKKWGFLPVQ